MTLVERIRRLCLEHGISVRQLELRTGLAERTIGRWNDNKPSIDKVEKVADYFGVSIDYLLGRDDAAMKPAKIRNEDLKYAIFNVEESEVTDEMLAEVMNYAQWLKSKEAFEKHGHDG